MYTPDYFVDLNQIEPSEVMNMFVDVSSTNFEILKQWLKDFIESGICKTTTPADILHHFELQQVEVLQTGKLRLSRTQGEALADIVDSILEMQPMQPPASDAQVNALYDMSCKLSYQLSMYMPE